MPEIDLSYLDEAYEATKGIEEAPVQYGEPPDGDYKVFVERAHMKESAKKQTPYINWQFRIEDGPFKGKCLFKASYITAGTVQSLRRDWHTVTKDILPPPSEIQSNLEQLLDWRLQIRKKEKKGDWDGYDVWIQQNLGRVIPEDAPAGTSEFPTDDIPF